MSIPLRGIMTALSVALLLLGCSQKGGGQGSVAAISPPPSGVLGSTYAPSLDMNSPLPPGESILASFEVSFDLDTLTAHSQPIDTRSGAIAKQGELFDLDLGALSNLPSGLDPLSLWKIEALESDGSTLEITFSHAHPWPAPSDPGTTVPANSTSNRADLGYTGRAVFMQGLSNMPPGPETVYFLGPDSEVSSPLGMVNPDGFIHLKKPQSGINVAGTSDLGSIFDVAADTASAFPFKLLVDESLDSRIAVSNGGNAAGNYDPAVRGWQISNLSANERHDQWTGFDYLHQGQVTLVSARFNLTQLAGTTLRVIILVKYSDPRRSGQFNYNLPRNIVEVPMLGSDPTDPTGETLRDIGALFAYRMPFGALDLSQIKCLNSSIDEPIRISTGTSSTASLNFVYRDWDRQAAEAPLASKPLFDPDRDAVTLTNPVDKVPEGTAGDPLVSISVPQLSASTFGITGSLGTQSGRAGAEVAFSSTITNALGFGSGSHELIWGMVRIEDPENLLGADVDGWSPHTALIPNSSPPEEHSVRKQELVTYQMFPIQVDCATLGTPAVTFSETQACGDSLEFTLNASGAELPDTVIWNFASGSVEPELVFGSNPSVTTLKSGTFTGTVMAFNSNTGCSPMLDSQPLPFQYTIAPAAPPSWNRSFALDGPGNAIGRFNSIAIAPSGAPASIANRAAITYFDGVANDLMLCLQEFPGGGFLTPEIIDSGATPPSASGLGFAGRHGDLLISNSHLAVSYLMEDVVSPFTSSEVRVAVRDLSNWGNGFFYAVVDSGVADGASLSGTSITSYDDPPGLAVAISYVLAAPSPASPQLRVAWNRFSSPFPSSAGDWSKEVVDTFSTAAEPAVASIQSFVVGDLPHLAVAYYNPDTFGLTLAASPSSMSKTNLIAGLSGATLDRLSGIDSLSSRGRFPCLRVVTDPLSPLGSSDRLVVGYMNFDELSSSIVLMYPQVQVSFFNFPFASNDEWQVVNFDVVSQKGSAAFLSGSQLNARPFDMAVVNNRPVCTFWAPSVDLNPVHFGKLIAARSCTPIPQDPDSWSIATVVDISPDGTLGRHLSCAGTNNGHILLSHEQEPGSGNINQSTLQKIESDTAW